MNIEDEDSTTAMYLRLMVLKHCIKHTGSTHANAQQRALDFISETEAMREGDTYKQTDIEHLIEKENGKNI